MADLNEVSHTFTLVTREILEPNESQDEKVGWHGFLEFHDGNGHDVVVAAIYGAPTRLDAWLTIAAHLFSLYVGCQVVREEAKTEGFDGAGPRPIGPSDTLGFEQLPVEGFMMLINDGLFVLNDFGLFEPPLIPPTPEFPSSEPTPSP